MMADIPQKICELVAGALLLPALAPMLSRSAMAANNTIKIALLLQALLPMVAGVHWHLLDYRA
ncbi:hypothetical protein LZ023_38735 (plasmid) [Pseudomonas silvicola]|nr:hypothetical protein LZ023_38735 [Pseudomonas silvicola]